MQEKDKNISDQGSDKNSNQNKDKNIQSDFNQGSYFQFLSHKSERLSAAVYMLSNFFDQNEPLRFTLRNLSVRLVSMTMSLRNMPARERQSQVRFVINCTEEIIAFCHIARSAGLISEMNQAILDRELHAFLSDMEAEKVARDEEKLLIPSEFFNTAPSGQEQKNTAQFFGQNLFDQRSLKREIGPRRALNEPSIRKPVSSFKGHSLVKDSNHLKMSLRNIPERKDRILAVFKQTGKKLLTINDFSGFIKDCSEKTIQRQLLDLVKDNVLQKEGERRWSRYSLKDK